jgi:hypothetical protein
MAAATPTIAPTLAPVEYDAARGTGCAIATSASRSHAGHPRGAPCGARGKSPGERATRRRRRALRVAHNRYREGYASYLEELDAQRTLFSAEQTVAQLRADSLTAHVNLYRALGGGWTSGP